MSGIGLQKQQNNKVRQQDNGNVLNKHNLNKLNGILEKKGVLIK